jgi:hypothetical protein
MRIVYLLEDANPAFRKAEDDPKFPQLNSASSRFTAVYPGQVLKFHGHDVEWHFVNKHTGVRDGLVFNPGDVVVCVRSYFNEMAGTAKRAKAAGAVVVIQQNDPHIVSTSEDLKEVRDTHKVLMGEICDGIIACSPTLAELCKKHALYPDNVIVNYDSLDTQYNAPRFEPAPFLNGEKTLKLATACYPHNLDDILVSLPSIETFAAQYGQVHYTISTKPSRPDQRHHGDAYGTLEAYQPSTSKLKIELRTYSTADAAKIMQEADIGIVQHDGGKRSGYKKEWSPNRSNGRGAAFVWAGNPFYCADDILSYRVFLNQNGGYNAERDVGKTLEMLVTADPKKINSAIFEGQGIVSKTNSPQAIAEKQYAFFTKLRKQKGFYKP